MASPTLTRPMVTISGTGIPGLPQQQDALLHVAQEQVPGHIVEEADAKQQSPEPMRLMII